MITFQAIGRRIGLEQPAGIEIKKIDQDKLVELFLGNPKLTVRKCSVVNGTIQISLDYNSFDTLVQAVVFCDGEQATHLETGTDCWMRLTVWVSSLNYVRTCIVDCKIKDTSFDGLKESFKEARTKIISYLKAAK